MDPHEPQAEAPSTGIATRPNACHPPAGSTSPAPTPDLRDDEELRSAIHWTARRQRESLLAGLAWRLDMDRFFEAWVEAIAAATAARVGATLRSGRTEQTRVPLDWNPATAGSQRSLLPDVVLQRDDLIVVLDAKYKQHAADIERLGWHDADRTLKERHRNDLMQAIAYSTLFDAPKIVTLLVYPCGVDAHRRLVERGRAHALARIRTTPRNLYVGLMAVPLGGDVRVPAAGLEGVVRGIA